MTIWVTVESADPSEIFSLQRWLDGERETSLRSDLVDPGIAEGRLGGVFDTLSVAVASGGALSVLASSVIVWLRQRSSDVLVKVSNGDRSVHFSAKRIQQLDAQSVENMVADTLKTLESSE